MKSVNWSVLTFPSTAGSGRGSRNKEFCSAVSLAGPAVIVDLAGCRSLSHQDIELLLQCLEQAAERNTQVRLVAASDVVRVLLEVMRIASVVPVFATVEEAREFRPEETGVSAGMLETNPLNSPGMHE